VGRNFGESLFDLAAIHFVNASGGAAQLGPAASRPCERHIGRSDFRQSQHSALLKQFESLCLALFRSCDQQQGKRDRAPRLIAAPRRRLMRSI